MLQDIKRLYNDRPYPFAEKLVEYDAKAWLKDRPDENLEFLSTFLDLDLSDISSLTCINCTIEQ